MASEGPVSRPRANSSVPLPAAEAALFKAVKSNDAAAFEACCTNCSVGNEELDINYSDRQGRTVLHFAAESSLEIVQRLVELGAVVNMCDNHGNTPLHRAALVDAYDIIKFLLGCGASPLMCNADGETPANVAIAQANAKSAGILREHIKLLQSCPVQPTKPVPVAVSSTTIQILWEFPDNGSDLGVLPVIKRYEIAYGVRNSFGWTYKRGVYNGTARATIEGLLPDTPYTCKIRGENSNGWGSYSKKSGSIRTLGVSESSIHVETENQSPGTDRRQRKSASSSPSPKNATKVDAEHNVDEKLAHNTSYEDEANVALKRTQVLEKERDALASVASAAELRYREANRLLQDESSASAALLNRVHRLERELLEMKQKDQQEQKQDSLIDGAGLSIPQQNQYDALEQRVNTQEKEISILRAGLKSSDAALQSMQESRDRAEARCLELAKDRDRALDEISALKASLQDLAPSHEREIVLSMSRGMDFEQRFVEEQEARLAQEML